MYVCVYVCIYIYMGIWREGVRHNKGKKYVTNSYFKYKKMKLMNK